MSLPEDESEPDQGLVERFRRGDREAFNRIVARYRRDVYRIARRMTGSHEDADDVAQDTFVRAFGALGTFRGESTLKTWLCRIALNLAINVGRSRSSHRTEDKDFDRISDGDPKSVPAGERALLREEEDQRVRGAIGRLADRQRQVVVLRIYEEMKFHEIADLLDCPIGTVKANFFHAMNNLRKTLR